jgi:hypothetical protein
MEEFKAGKLHSGSKAGPEVKSRAQAIAIGLSEERKEGHKVGRNHSEPTAPGMMGPINNHHIEQGHKVSGRERKNDGAGRHGSDMDIRGATEHKAPMHPDKHAHAPSNPAAGVAGYPGELLKMGNPAPLVGHSHNAADHQPAVLRHTPGPAGYPGNTAGMSTKVSGYGHQQSQKDGVHRLSGHPGAHRIGKR